MSAADNVLRATGPELNNGHVRLRRWHTTEAAMSGPREMSVSAEDPKIPEPLLRRVFRRGATVAVLILLATIIGALGFALIVGTVMFSPRPGTMQSIRYLETIHYEVGGELRVANGVREVRLSVNEGAIGAGPGVFLRSLQGEAIVLSDSADGLVLALAKYPYTLGQRAITLIEAACGPHRSAISRGANYEDRLKQWLAEIADFQGPCSVPTESWPLLVRFTDPARPESVERLASSNIETGRGSVPRILSVTVEPTTEPLVSSLVERLAWLNEPETVPWGLLTVDGPSVSRNPDIQLQLNDFVPEVTK